MNRAFYLHVIRWPSSLSVLDNSDKGIERSDQGAATEILVNA